MKVVEKVQGFLMDKGLSLAEGILKMVIIAAVGLLIIHIINKSISKLLEKSKLEKTAHSLIKTLVKTVLYLLLVLIIASSVGINVTGIVALASVLTLALSLSLQDMLSNIIGGFTLIYTKPFKAGDYVEIAGQSGSVQEIGIAYTRLSTPDNKEVSIPNKSVVASDIVNYTAIGTRRIDITVSVSYDSDCKKVIETLLKAAEHEKALVDPKPFAALSKYGDSSIEYVLRMYSSAADYWDVYFDVVGKIKPMFDEAGIEMTYPHLNIHLDK